MNLLTFKDDLVKPILIVIPRWIKPNHLTWLRIIMVGPLIWLLMNRRYGIAGVWFALALSLDALDGTLARTRDQITRLGMALDPIADKILFLSTMLLLGYALLPLWLFISVIIIETATMTASALFPALVQLYPTFRLPVAANRIGQYKFASYGIATVLLFMTSLSPLITMTSAGLFILGCILGIVSFFQYILLLANGRQRR